MRNKLDFHQPMFHSIHGDADHVSGFDFGHDVVAVGFDGFSLDKENIGYFLACFFLTNQLHDFLISWEVSSEVLNEGTTMLLLMKS